MSEKVIAKLHQLVEFQFKSVYRGEQLNISSYLFLIIYFEHSNVTFKFGPSNAKAMEIF